MLQEIRPSTTVKHVPISQVVLDVVTRNPKENPRKSFVYVDLSAIDQEEKAIRGARILEGFQAPSRARQFILSGDILVSTVRPNLNGVAIVDLRHDKAIASTRFCVLRPNVKFVDPIYLFHWVRCPEFISEMVKNATGANYPAVTDRIVKQSQIPLLPLSEQRRIAAILDQADAGRAKRREALAKLDEMGQAIFVEMFGRDKTYPAVRLDEVCSLITDGTHQTPTYSDEGVIFLSARNVASGRIDWSNIKKIPQELHGQLRKRLVPRRGDVLLAKNGTTGMSAIVDRDVVFDIYVSLALLRPKSVIDVKFLWLAMNSAKCREQFSGALKGVGVKNLHLADIRQTRIPFPPLDAQEKIVKRFEKIEAISKNFQMSSVELEFLFASLQSRAFRGEL